MPDLSPAAQAVLDAYYCDTPLPGSKRVAAALRALAVRIKGADDIRQDILDIANELGPIHEKTAP